MLNKTELSAMNFSVHVGEKYATKLRPILKKAEGASKTCARV